ncbi:MAG: flavin reductase [Nitrososphaerota archaeon]|nr:flavin reductase [Nitrososphaerota archaeon]MDG6924390.1 flavin reductase [Nitrososphaerota archaeon]
MPVASTLSVSNSPPRIAVSVKRRSNTHHVLRSAKTLSLNWLPYQKRTIITELSRSAAGNDKLRSMKVPYRVIFGSPILEDSVAYVIAAKERVIVLGDHDLFIGRVIGAMASLDFDEYWKFKGYRPILYLGSYHKKRFASIRK